MPFVFEHDVAVHVYWTTRTGRCFVRVVPLEEAGRRCTKEGFRLSSWLLEGVIYCLPRSQSLRQSPKYCLCDQGGPKGRLGGSWLIVDMVTPYCSRSFVSLNGPTTNKKYGLLSGLSFPWGVDSRLSVYGRDNQIFFLSKIIVVQNIITRDSLEVLKLI